MADHIKREMRYFRNHYLCSDPRCDNEWSDEMLVVGPSYCPCCEREADPYASDPLLEELKALVEHSLGKLLDDDETTEVTDLTNTHAWPEAA
jgi:hypothetical protein